MQNRTLRLLVAVTTCAVAIVAGSIWSNSPHAQVKSDGLRALVVVEDQPDAPVGISVFNVHCSDGFAYYSSRVTARTTKAMKRIEIRRSAVHHGIVDFGDHCKSITGAPEGVMRTTDLENGVSGEGVKLSRGWFREPIDEVRVYVWSVTFADGSEWHRPLAK